MKPMFQQMLQKIKDMPPEELAAKWDKAGRDTAHLNSPNAEHYMKYAKLNALIFESKTMDPNDCERMVQVEDEIMSLQTWLDNFGKEEVSL